jgi:diaminopropionate ammonia-lyase
MDNYQNPYRAQGAGLSGLGAIPFPADDAGPALRLLQGCPAAAVTPLVDSPRLAKQAAVSAVWVKDERGRMGLGSFKALGAAYVIARDADATGSTDLRGALAGQTYVTASAGNHGLSVAAGARVFGAHAVVYIAETVPESFAARLRDRGAEVRREGTDYEASVDAAKAEADRQGWRLLSDSSWPGYTDRPHRLMEGYLAMAAEAADAVAEPPSHIFLQAGVGGLAGAVAAFARARWGDGPVIVVVEPEAAPALTGSIRAGRPVPASGPVSVMGRLDCKEPSLIALKGLARDADYFTTISEAEAMVALPKLAAAGLATSASGGAGLAALLAAAPGDLGLNAASRVLCFLSEGPEE